MQISLSNVFLELLKTLRDLTSENIDKITTLTLIMRRNSSGPKTKPWGTPNLLYVSIHLSRLLRKPSLYNSLEREFKMNTIIRQICRLNYRIFLMNSSILWDVLSEKIGRISASTLITWRNISGSRTKPWGTPNLYVTISDEIR